LTVIPVSLPRQTLPHPLSKRLVLPALAQFIAKTAGRNGVFGLWTGILATGFAAETRRDNFLKTWETVSKVPETIDAGAQRRTQENK
jgi:hypothetical protein